MKSTPRNAPTATSRPVFRNPLANCLRLHLRAGISCCSGSKSSTCDLKLSDLRQDTQGHSTAAGADAQPAQKKSCAESLGRTCSRRAGERDICFPCSTRNTISQAQPETQGWSLQTAGRRKQGAQVCNRQCELRLLDQLHLDPEDSHYHVACSCHQTKSDACGHVGKAQETRKAQHLIEKQDDAFTHPSKTGAAFPTIHRWLQICPGDKVHVLAVAKTQLNPDVSSGLLSSVKHNQ